MKIEVLLPEETNEFQVLQATEARATAAHLGVDVAVAYADNNAILQIQQLYLALRGESKPQAIAIEPIGIQGTETVLRKAAAAGIGVAVLNGTSEVAQRLSRAFPGVAAFAVGSDQVEIGRIQGRQVHTLLPSGGTVLYVQGPRGVSAAEERLAGFQEIVGRYANIRVIALDGHWTEQSAERAVQNWLRLRSSSSIRIDLVAAQDDSMARGARRALESAPESRTAGLDIAYLGIDGVPHVGQRLVDEGTLTGTVIMPSNTRAAIERLVRWVRTGIPPASVTLAVRSYPDEIQPIRRTPNGDQRSGSRRPVLA